MGKKKSVKRVSLVTKLRKENKIYGIRDKNLSHELVVLHRQHDALQHRFKNVDDRNVELKLEVNWLKQLVQSLEHKIGKGVVVTNA